MAMKMKKMSAMKAMKAMKMAKKMSGMKKMAMKAKKVSVRGKKWQVLKGTRAKTIGGLKKSDLRKNKNGKVVSIKQSNRGKANKWTQASTKARKALNVTGWCAIGGKKK